MRQLMFVLSFITGYAAQTERLVMPPYQGQANSSLVAYQGQPPVVVHDAHDLTVRDIIEILADYDVKHADQQPFFRPAFGVTNFESYPPAIWIFNTADTPSRRSTALHELLHVYYHQRQQDPPEEFIRSEEDRLYQKLFGVTP